MTTDGETTTDGDTITDGETTDDEQPGHFWVSLFKNKKQTSYNCPINIQHTNYKEIA